MTSLRCSIIVPVFNHAELTRRRLDGLLRCRKDDEVIVVDDCSEDTTPVLLESYGSQIKRIRRAKNGGYSAACNTGAAAARADRLVFLNNDTFGTDGWLERLLAYGARNPAASIVGAKLLYPDNSVQHAGVVIGSERLPIPHLRGFPSEHPAVNVSRRFQGVTGACISIDRSAFEALDGFDEGYLNGYEDVDFCLRAGAAGHEVHYCHESLLYHVDGATRGRDGHERGARRFLERWGERLAQDDVGYFAEDGLIEVRVRGPLGVEVSVSPVLGRAVAIGNSGNQLELLLDRRTHEAAALRDEVHELRGHLETTAAVGAEPPAEARAVNVDEAAPEPAPRPRRSIWPSE